MAGKYGKKNEVKIDPLAYNICILGEPKIGKEQPISEPILSENGWLPMGDIKIGMKVYGRDGKLYTVTGVFPQGIKDVYEVVFSDGTKTRCGLEHLWHVTTKKQRELMKQKGDYRFKVKTLEEIMKDYKKSRNCSTYQKYNYKYSIPINKEIEFKQNGILPLNPYIMGLLLGDGGFTNSVVTFTNSEQELFHQLETELNKMNMSLSIREFKNHKQATIINNEDTCSNKINDIIKNLGLYGVDSRNKFIPQKYIYSSIQSRREILSGIINTDGSVYEDVGLQVSTYSKQMALDIAETARSIGYISIINNYDRTNENSSEKYATEIEYHVSIIGDYSKLSLSQKHKNKLKNRTWDYCKVIRDIKSVGQEESQCII